MFVSPRRIALSILASASAISLSTPALAQDPERMEQVIEAEAESGAFMGAVLVAQGDEELLNKAWGSADLEWNVANTPQTKFRIGSVTKQFTSVAIFLLAEQGKLDIDAPISTYLEDTPQAWEAITVRHLMRHSAGLPNVTSLDGFGRLKYLPTTQDELIATFRDLPLEFEPGSAFKYSNSGYVLLSRIVEKLSEQSLGDFYQSNFFEPLGMRETALDDTAKIIPRRADGYSPAANGRVNADYVDMGIPTGAGALYSTTADLHKWNTGLFSGEIISQESLEEFLKPSAFDAFDGDGYAHGVLKDVEGDDIYYYHGGGIEGFNAWLGYDPARSTTVAVLANLNGGSATKLGTQMMELVRGGEVTLPSEREVVELSFEPADYEGVYSLAPTFKITVFTQDGKFMAQATGQSAFELFPESEDMFFLKVVDAQVRFERDESGAVKSLTLFQNGAEVPGIKE